LLGRFAGPAWPLARSVLHPPYLNDFSTNRAPCCVHRKAGCTAGVLSPSALATWPQWMCLLDSSSARSSPEQFRCRQSRGTSAPLPWTRPAASCLAAAHTPHPQEQGPTTFRRGRIADDKRRSYPQPGGGSLHWPLEHRPAHSSRSSSARSASATGLTAFSPRHRRLLLPCLLSPAVGVVFWVEARGALSSWCCGGERGARTRSAPSL
jgi:hypothetical protein